jgi:NET1-associated nuclear protein 1 (U3 small nucleolar RNA-associated protein 17)
VTLVAISQDGSMMSTVEVKQPEEGIGGLVCLKFWALGSENKKFSLSTVIYEPHRLALAYIPKNSEIFYQEG